MVYDPRDARELFVAPLPLSRSFAPESKAGFGFREPGAPLDVGRMRAEGSEGCVEICSGFIS